MFKKVLIIGCGLIGSSILRAVHSKKLSKKLNWVMSHPISGSEASGPKFGSKNLFKNKWCILIKSKKKKLLNKGLILRDTKTYGIKNCLRLTIGNNLENKLFLKFMNRIFKNV